MSSGASSGGETMTSTGELTTEEPTTDGPTTEEPTTDGPTTEDPTTEEPTTEDPTEEPTTEDPTEEPTTEEPTTEDPTDTGCDASTWYEDSDGDGYGDPDAQQEACAQPDGYVDNADDCRDKGEGAEVMHPGLTEICDSFDNDCDGVIDEFSGDNVECGGCKLAEFDGSVYFFCDFNERWQDARDYCSEAFGVDLVSIAKEPEDTFIKDNIGFAGRWIGANDLDEEDAWQWVDGSDFDFDDWGWGQPANWVGNEDCAQANSNRWEAENCDSDLRFICEGPG
ncbi:MAG: lectin-like protein [Nannocystaceae bacterium]